MIKKEEINEWFTFPKYSVDSLDISDELSLSRKQILRVQNEPSGLGNCYLSFYALAKNIRFVSSYFYESIKNGKKPIISTARPGETEFWFQKTRDNWHPWMPTRYSEKNSNNKESWSNIFSDLEDFAQIESEYSQNSNLNNFFLYLACLDHTFRVNPDFSESISKIISDLPSEKVCGMQIRRGEIVPKDGASPSSCRPIYSIDEYVDGLRIVCEKLSTNNVFVSTDSDETVDYLVENYKEFNFIFNKYDRSFFLRFDGNKEPALEFDLQSRPELIRHYTETCIADLISLSKCHGYVGGMKHSEFGICGWFLQMVKQQNIGPYFNVEGDLDLKNGPLKMLLL
jgi:hypothetical protein